MRALAPNSPAGCVAARWSSAVVWPPVGRWAEREPGTQVGVQMKNEFYRRAKLYNLPLYAETRMRKNAIVYQKFGFQLFNKWEHPSGDTMYFLKYIPEEKSE